MINHYLFYFWTKNRIQHSTEKINNFSEILRNVANFPKSNHSIVYESCHSDLSHGISKKVHEYKNFMHILCKYKRRGDFKKINLLWKN